MKTRFLAIASCLLLWGNTADNAFAAGKKKSSRKKRPTTEESASRTPRLPVKALVDLANSFPNDRQKGEALYKISECQAEMEDFAGAFETLKAARMTRGRPTSRKGGFGTAGRRRAELGDWDGVAKLLKSLPKDKRVGFCLEVALYCIEVGEFKRAYALSEMIPKESSYRGTIYTNMRRPLGVAGESKEAKYVFARLPEQYRKDSRYKDGLLEYYARQGNMEKIKEMLGGKIKVDIRNSPRITVIARGAAHGGHTKILEFLLTEAKKDRMVGASVIRDIHVETVKALIRKGKLDKAAQYYGANEGARDYDTLIMFVYGYLKQAMVDEALKYAMKIRDGGDHVRSDLLIEVFYLSLMKRNHAVAVKALNGIRKPSRDFFEDYLESVSKHEKDPENAIRSLKAIESTQAQYNMLGRYMMQLAAQGKTKQAIALHDETPPAVSAPLRSSSLFRGLILAGDLKTAVAIAEKKGLDGYAHLAYAAAATDKTALAEQLIAKHKLTPEDRQVIRKEMAVAYARTKKYDKALAVAKEFVHPPDRPKPETFDTYIEVVITRAKVDPKGAAKDFCKQTTFTAASTCQRMSARGYLKEVGEFISALDQLHRKNISNDVIMPICRDFQNLMKAQHARALTRRDIAKAARKK